MFSVEEDARFRDEDDMGVEADLTLKDDEVVKDEEEEEVKEDDESRTSQTHQRARHGRVSTCTKGPCAEVEP